MAQARQEDNWNHTASVMALISNVNRDPKRGRPARPADFHPALTTPRRRRAQPPAALKGDIGMLKSVFIDQMPQGGRRVGGGGG